MTSRTIRVRNTTRGTLLGERIGVADGVWSRFVGLLGKSALAPGAGLLIHPSQGVHTIGMMFPIDVIFLDRDHRVVGFRENMKPFRLTGLKWSASSVLELPVSSIRATSTQLHDQLLIESALSPSQL